MNSRKFWFNIFQRQKQEAWGRLPGRSYLGLILSLTAGLGFIWALISVFSKQAPTPQALLGGVPENTFSQAIAGVGIVEPEGGVIRMDCEKPGVVRKIFVRTGDHVKTGDPLLALDTRDADATLLVWKKKVAAAQIQANDAKDELITATKQPFQRVLAEDGINRRRYKKDLAMMRLEEAKAEWAKACLAWEKLILRSPIDGQVLETDTAVGECVGGSTPGPTMRLGSVTGLEVKVEFDEEYIARLDPKGQAYGTLRGAPSHKIPLQFVRMDPYVKAKKNTASAGQRIDTRVVHVTYRLPKDTTLIPGFILVGQEMDVFAQAHEEDAKKPGVP